ncbi:MAG: flagellar biosynthetic protein FliO [Gammaproteobacteria bacterium]|nr:flagellar biosynthetic protein FliO [Gammaproteobacteria bacterium]
MKRDLASVALLITGMAPFGCTGAEEGGPVTGLAVSSLGTGALAETAGGLLLILGLIVGLGWLFRRFGRLPIAGKGLVTVLGGVSLGPRERAVVLQVGDERLLVGVAPGRVQTLHVFDSASATAVESPGTEFGEQLQAQLETRSS